MNLHAVPRVIRGEEIRRRAALSETEQITIETIQAAMDTLRGNQAWTPQPYQQQYVANLFPVARPTRRDSLVYTYTVTHRDSTDPELLLELFGMVQERFRREIERVSGTAVGRMRVRRIQPGDDFHIDPLLQEFRFSFRQDVDIPI